MISCKAYILRERGVIPSLEDIKVDDNLLEGQVLVRILYSGLCATQLEEIFVASRNEKYMPHLFGHEGVGTVEKVGPNVSKIGVGDICVIHWKTSSKGLDSSPGRYLCGEEKLSAGKVVTFSEIAVLPENRLTKLTSSLKLHIAPLLGCAYPTGWGSVLRAGNASHLDRLLIVGLGGVGLSALEAALSLPVISVSTVDPNRMLPSSPKFAQRVTHFSNLEDLSIASENPTIVVDTSGDVETLQQLVDSLEVRSRLVLVGMPKSQTHFRVPIQKMLDGLEIIGSNGGGVDPGIDFIHYERLLSECDTNTDGLAIAVSSRTQLADCIENHLKGRFRRAVLGFC